MEITLQEITRENFYQVIKLQVHPHEKEFVAQNIYSIAQAYTEPGSTPKAIYYREEPVGFTMYGQFEEDEGDYWIARLMVHIDYRRKGYAEKAMKLAIEEMKNQEDCKQIFVSFVPGNIEAKNLYDKLGFKDTQEMEDGEHVYVMKIN